MKVAILGGTFNPIHNGHLALADTAVETFVLGKIIFMPTYIPPHKDIEKIISADDRFNMAELAIEGNDKYEASRLEINRRNVSYSVDSISYIKKIYPKDTEIFFLIGSDSAAALDTWKNIDKVFSICRFVVGLRAGHTLETKDKNIEIMPMEPVDISSTEIRAMLKQGKDIHGLVPEKVADYIEKNRLYK